MILKTFTLIVFNVKIYKENYHSSSENCDENSMESSTVIDKYIQDHVVAYAFLSICNSLTLMT